MKEKLAIMLIGFTVLFVHLLTPDATKARSEISIGGKAGNYHYKVIMGQEPFTWEIGHKGSMFVIEESENNRDELNTFRSSVEDIKIQKFKVGFSVFYLFVIGMVLVLARITFYYGLTASFGLNHSLRDAEFYYLDLMH